MEFKILIELDQKELLWFDYARRMYSTMIKRGTLEINWKRICDTRPRRRGFMEVTEKGNG
jgi:hypothetical protein